MVEIGKFNSLRVVKELNFGVYLDGGESGEILLPKRYVPENCSQGDIVEVFVYKDSEDRIIATTEKPYVVVGDYALLKVVSVNEVGAFLDWGLMKDLLVPFREQGERMEEGKSYIVHVYFDEKSERLAASSNLAKFLNKIPPEYEEGQEVSLLVCNETEIGYRAIIDKSHWGMIYKNEVFQPLKIGQTIRGFVKKVRDDGKIDLSLQKAGYENIDDFTEIIINRLEKAGGYIAVTDKSTPETIYRLFGMSKKSYKKAVGALYKKKVIDIENNGIKLKNNG